MSCLCERLVALLRLVPEDPAERPLAGAVRDAGRAVVGEGEGAGAGALRVPLEALARGRPVVLVVARRAAALAAVALAGVLLEDHELAVRARAAAAHLVALYRGVSLRR